MIETAVEIRCRIDADRDYWMQNMALPENSPPLPYPDVVCPPECTGQQTAEVPRALGILTRVFGPKVVDVCPLKK